MSRLRGYLAKDKEEKTLEQNQILHSAKLLRRDSEWGWICLRCGS